MGLFDILIGKQPTGRHQVGPIGEYASEKPSEDTVDAALGEMQDYTGDELVDALSYKFEGMVKRWVDGARQDISALPKQNFYVPITFPDGKVAYAALPTLASMERDLKQVGIILGAHSHNLKAIGGMPSTDAIDSLIEKYSAAIENVLPISGMNPLNEVYTRLRNTLIGYIKEQVMSVLQRPQIPGYDVLGRKELEQRIAEMQPYKPGLSN